MHIASKMRNNTGIFHVEQEFYCHRCDKRFTERKYLNEHLNSLHQGKSDFCDQDEDQFQALLYKMEDQESAKTEDSMGEEIVERKEKIVKLPSSPLQEDCKECILEICTLKEEFEYFQKKAAEDIDKDLKPLEELRAKLLIQIDNLKPKSRGGKNRSQIFFERFINKLMRKVRRGMVTKTGKEEFQKEAEDSDAELHDLRARLLTQIVIGNLKPRHLKKILRKVRKGRVTKTVAIRGQSIGSR